MSALPEAYVRRFGEIVWAQGGNGYGWWPSCIFDPRLTMGHTRELASKNLGRRHLIYFFQCDEAPFSVLHNSKIQDWTSGLVDSLYLGKAARSYGKDRYKQFLQAHQAAILEESKPWDERLQWNQLGAPPASKNAVLGSPVAHSSQQQKPKKLKRKREHREENDENQDSSSKEQTNRAAGTSKRRRSATPPEFRGGQANSAFIRFESPEKELYCQVNRRTENDELENLGFVQVNSRQESTFAEVRRMIASELVDETISSDWDWRFVVPSLGRVSLKQEEKFGAMLPFLRSAATGKVGSGTIASPVMLELVDAEMPLMASPNRSKNT